MTRAQIVLLAGLFGMVFGMLFTAVVLSDSDRACSTVQHETGKTCP